MDANNLHGWAVCKKLSLNGYKWANVGKFDIDFIKNYNDNCNKGYLLEVHVEYPKELYSSQSDLPFSCEKRSKLHKELEYKVSEEVKKAHRTVYKTLNITHEPETENKLIATIQEKDKYVVCISTLKQALNHGLKLRKVHRVIEFNKSAWLEMYIDKNTALTKLAENDLEKGFFKIMKKGLLLK